MKFTQNPPSPMAGATLAIASQIMKLTKTIGSRQESHLKVAKGVASTTTTLVMITTRRNHRWMRTTMSIQMTKITPATGIMMKNTQTRLMITTMNRTIVMRSQTSLSWLWRC